MTQPNKTEAIKQFLVSRTLADLAAQYHYGMEVQVNVAQDGGRRHDGTYRGKQFTAWTDDTGQVWKSFRVPWKAATNPSFEDRPIGFDLEAHAEAIGMTGWNWQTRQSIYVAYDFDSIINHQVGITDAELARVRTLAESIPWVTIRKSTSGSGLHLYVYLDPVTTENHTEHAALARAVLSKMSSEVGYDFSSSVDVSGGNMWVWHRKFEGSDGGLVLLKQGELLTNIPVNWKSHLSVTGRHRSKAQPHFIADSEQKLFEEVCGRHVEVPLEDAHKRVMRELDALGALWWWDSDRHMLVAHTADLKEVHGRLGLRGLFETISVGKERGIDQNAFAHPYPDGGWVVRRHTKGVAEAPTWEKDNSGWTRCYLNRLPDFNTAMVTKGGLEDEKSAFIFADYREAEAAVKALGGEITIPEVLRGRDYTISKHRSDNTKVVVRVPKADIDKEVSGWFLKGKMWTVVITTSSDGSADTVTFDDMVRHLVAENNSDAGWVLRGSDGHWIEEPMAHIRVALKSQGQSGGEVDQIMGSGVMNRWRLTNTPFQEEYPGNKVWNRDAVQLAMAPTLDVDHYEHPTWDKVLNHCGQELDYEIKMNSWCIKNGIVCGGDYLKLWISSLIQEPDQPLPYLFFYGPQGSGKSIFHESLSILMTRGIMRADSALISGSGFNGELASAVLCVSEETDLRRDKTQAYNRIKDWTTGNTISIHQKGRTPYLAKNYTHWVQMSNDMESCPVFPGDTRITMIFVDMLKPEEYVAKKDLLGKLKVEAPDFLGAVLRLEIPSTTDRFNIPVIVTNDKLIAEQTNQNDLEAFIQEQCHHTPGFGMPWKDFYNTFKEYLDPQARHLWSKRRTGQLMPPKFPKARNMADGAQFWIGNISFSPLPDPDILDGVEPCRVVGEKLVNLIGRAPC